MTLAICIRCGAERLGALTPCPGCGFDPTTPEDRAKSLALSDHNMRPEELAEAQERIGAGEEISYDEAYISEMADFIRQNPDLTRDPLGCTIAVWTLVAIAVVLALYVFLF